MNTPSTTSMDSVDQQGLVLGRQLQAWSGDLSHDISERLRVIRMQALEVQKPEIVRASRVHAQSNGTLTLTPDGADRPSLWSVLGSIIPVAALVLGASTLMLHEENQRINEIAHIDVELLADDVPPSAYADPGFIQFLHEMAHRQEQHD